MSAGPGNTVALPELDVARVQRWCAARVPDHALHQVRVECVIASTHLTVIERRAPSREDYGPEWSSFPIARLRYIDAVLARPESALSPLRPCGGHAQRRRATCRNRPRPDRHLLGLNREQKIQGRNDVIASILCYVPPGPASFSSRRCCRAASVTGSLRTIRTPTALRWGQIKPCHGQRLRVLGPTAAKTPCCRCRCVDIVVASLLR